MWWNFPDRSSEKFRSGIPKREEKITFTERKQIAFIKIEVAFEVDDSEMSR